MSLAKDLRATKISGIEQGLSRASESSPVTEFGKSLATVTVVCKFSICFASYKGLKCLIAADFNVCCPLKMLPAVSSISQMCFLLLQELAKFLKKFGVKDHHFQSSYFCKSVSKWLLLEGVDSFLIQVLLYQCCCCQNVQPDLLIVDGVAARIQSEEVFLSFVFYERQPRLLYIL